VRMISSMRWPREGARICRHGETVLAERSGRMLDFLRELCDQRWSINIPAQVCRGNVPLMKPFRGNFMCKTALNPRSCGATI